MRPHILCVSCIIARPLCVLLKHSSLFLFIIRCDSIDRLRSRLHLLENEISDSQKFKDFYQFTFNFAKNPGQKSLGKRLAYAFLIPRARNNGGAGQLLGTAVTLSGQVYLFVIKKESFQEFNKGLNSQKIKFPSARRSFDSWLKTTCIVINLRLFLAFFHNSSRESRARSKTPAPTDKLFQRTKVKKRKRTLKEEV